MLKMDEGAERIAERPRVSGRYLFLGEEKFFIKGVTYGPFAPNRNGEPFPEPEKVDLDFRMMREAGVNTARVYYVPPRWVLDLARTHGVYLLVGIPWPQHLCFLDQWEVKEDVKDKIRAAAEACKHHPAVLAYLIGNEIPCHIVRWHGAKKIEGFLHKLTDIIRATDPGALVTYANYPSTEYLQLPFLDFLSFNVYLHDEKPFRGYLKRLQNVAGELPLVLSEFGMDSMRQGLEHQAETLGWQVRQAFELGASGAVVFAWTDEWFTGGNLIEDWAFGLVDAARAPKPALATVSDAFRLNVPGLPPDPPMISVVICAYNAEPTMEGCLASFLNVDYPSFEVIVIDDGSTDTTGTISDRYAERYPTLYKVIHQPNKGLSAARNAGLYAAEGSIVAYTDSDCYVDPHWLHYMAWAFHDLDPERFAAVGGPNLPPPEDNRTAACVAVSPGAPTHVLLTDEVAEHVPGCNMAFKKDRLLEIGGFDATYRAAGDDVDVCWRLQDKGYEIGFSAAMFVWHHRRCTISAYLKQQKGYGRAEALLAPKHHERFNALGNSRWAGRIYGDISGHLLTSRPVIYHGVLGYGLFQTLYEPKASLAQYLPLSFEWLVVSMVLLVLGPAMPVFAVAGGAMIAASLAYAVHRALYARLPEQYDDWRSRGLIALLTLSQPALRGWTRYKTLFGLTMALNRVRKHDTQSFNPWMPASDGKMPSTGAWQTLKSGADMLAHKFAFHRYFWNHDGMERDGVLQKLMAILQSMDLKPRVDSGFAVSGNVPPWDIQVQPGLWSQIQLRVTVENHGGDKRFIRLAGAVLPSGFVNGLFIGGTAITAAAAALGGHIVGLFLLAGLAAFTVWVVWDHFRAAALVGIISQHLMVCQSGPHAPAAEATPGQAPDCACDGLEGAAPAGGAA